MARTHLSQMETATQAQAGRRVQIGEQKEDTWHFPCVLVTYYTPPHTAHARSKVYRTIPRSNVWVHGHFSKAIPCGHS